MQHQQAPALSRADLLARLVFCSMMWSSGFLFMKLAGDVSAWVIASSRALIASVVIAAVFLALGQDPRPRPVEYRPWLVLGTLNGWLPNVLTAYALVQISAALSSMIQASGPIMVAVMAHFAFAEDRLTLRRLAGVLVGFGGMGLLIGPAAIEGSTGSMIGIGLMVLVSASYAVGNVYARTVRDVPATRMALGQQVVSAAVSLVIATLLVGREAIPSVVANAPALLALGLVATAIPITIFMTIIKRAGPTQAAMIGYLLPVWSTLMAMAFLGETVGLREVAGVAVILLGVWIVTTAPPAAELRAA